MTMIVRPLRKLKLKPGLAFWLNIDAYRLSWQDERNMFYAPPKPEIDVSDRNIPFIGGPNVYARGPPRHETSEHQQHRRWYG